jgi:hypothetical protein
MDNVQIQRQILKRRDTDRNMRMPFGPIVGAALTLVAVIWPWRHAESAVFGTLIAEANEMSSPPESRKPDETDSSAIGHSPPPQRETTGAKKTETGEATESRLPGEGGTPHPSNENEEYILEREPDGRYRIIGRRPRKPE